MKKVKSFILALTVLVLPCSVLAQEQTRITTTETAGTISELGQDTIVVQSESSSSPLRYSSTKSTTYIDETGAPVSVETVKSGLPVTVYYTREGDRMVADKVVVRKTTTTTGSPMIQEKRTRTTTTTETK
ncbi:hypothetical protein [uncultured Desulfobulbus sp.]|uniref:hypothetical protein n=1 Tax=uncultured Desulfobulbus sp. TaxID=239745 RepID=UPI0029C85FA2|nr:hypothetical protein [uncultured Desulfobulbus sp.]